jgi:hypothetical protein
VVDGYRWEEAKAAIRDILWLYRDLTRYNGFSGDHPTGSFHPWKWLACEYGGWGDEDDIRLLQEGSAVALLSKLIDTWDQGSGLRVETYEAAMRTGRFDHLPAARDAVSAGLSGTDDPQFTARSRVVYEEYVLGFFARLAGAR